MAFKATVLIGGFKSLVFLFQVGQYLSRLNRTFFEKPRRQPKFPKKDVAQQCVVDIMRARFPSMGISSGEGGI